MRAAQYKKALEITEHQAWAQQFWDDLIPLKNQVVKHPLFVEMGEGSLSLARFRCALLNFYPLVENFPKYMALNLAKTRPGRAAGHEESKKWLIENIKIEQRHAYWYQDWAMGFDISLTDLEQVIPPAPMDAVNNYLWSVGQQGSLEEGVAATNLAIEWATGEWSQNAVKGMQAYQEKGIATINRHSMAWLRAHASYDDAHPYEAMELIKRLAVSEQQQTQAFRAARRGLDYYIMALDYCYQNN
ncbi:MAG: iron-containing redox enzyme family protein [Alcanivorax sp.]|nr:iron-containing redox enzyme family protein [Alcanivorax sp.]